MKKLFLISTAFMFVFSLILISGNPAYSQNKPNKDTKKEIRKDNKQDNKNNPKHINQEKKNTHKKAVKPKKHPHKTTNNPEPAKKPE